MNQDLPFPNEHGFFSEPVSKRFSLSKVKDGANFTHRNTARISRIKIGTRRRDWAKWDVLKWALPTGKSYGGIEHHG
jgi:hypothetical protein